MYVHCTAGIGRAPQTVILYLCLYKKYSLDEALDLIKKKRYIANPNKSNENFVLLIFTKFLKRAFAGYIVKGLTVFLLIS